MNSVITMLNTGQSSNKQHH